MPLQFESTSHGPIAFGFFNIESDLLLLENTFIFADQFCKHIMGIPESATEMGIQTQWRVWQIERGPQLGDLMGSMHGMIHVGFFGELYRKYPFPRLREAFKQKPDGWKIQPDVAKIIGKYGREESIPFRVDGGGENVQIGDYAFTQTVFNQLINYVWEGGYPKWKDGQRPEYVLDMMKWIIKKKLDLFSGLAAA
jgi:hypothetical protein